MSFGYLEMSFEYSRRMKKILISISYTFSNDYTNEKALEDFPQGLFMKMLSTHN